MPLIARPGGSGAAAILRAVQDAAIAPTALILDRPFDNLRSRLRAHFTARGLPPIPLATIATFWVGLLRSLPAFQFAPSAWAAEARMPALVMADGGDSLGATSARAVHDHLAGARHWYRFDRRAGEVLAAQWQAKAGAFLSTVVKSSPGQGANEAVDAGVNLPGARPTAMKPLPGGGQ